MVGDNFSAGDFSWANFLWGGKFPGGQLLSGNHTMSEFAKIPIQNPFYTFSRAELLRVIVLGKL